MVELKNVSVTYSSGVDALHNVNLKINDGDFAFVVGASGAGKSTMIKLILKEINPTSGSISVNGYNLNKLRRRRIPAFLCGKGEAGECSPSDGKAFICAV